MPQIKIDKDSALVTSRVASDAPANCADLKDRRDFEHRVVSEEHHEVETKYESSRLSVIVGENNELIIRCSGVGCKAKELGCEFFQNKGRRL